MTQQSLEKNLIEVLSSHDAAQISIFGSRARGDAHNTSDLDVLVRFNSSKSLLKLVAIEQELSEKLGIKVDLLTEAAISPYLYERIRPELKIIYQ